MTLSDIHGHFTFLNAMYLMAFQATVILYQFHTFVITLCSVILHVSIKESYK